MSSLVKQGNNSINYDANNNEEEPYHPSYEELSPLEQKEVTYIDDLSIGIPLQQELLYKFEIVRLYKNIYLKDIDKPKDVNSKINLSQQEEDELIASQKTFKFIGDNNGMKKYYYNVQKTSTG